MFIVRADYNEKLEIKSPVEKIREFFSDIQNFLSLMPNIESIHTDGRGVTRWTIRAEIPVVGQMRQSFAVELTENSIERIEWSPARGEKENLLRCAADLFEKTSGSTLVQISQIVELRRARAKDLHPLAAISGASSINRGMQAEVSKMIKKFLQKSKEKLEK
jgi:Carbon monoxide dehydrogenase subunit G (CoxG).